MSEFFDITDPVDHELNSLDLSELTEMSLVHPEEYGARYQYVVGLLANFPEILPAKPDAQEQPEDGFTIFISNN